MPKLATVLLIGAGLLRPFVAFAGDEPPIEGDGRTKSYLRSLHGRVHRLWADTFLVMAESQLPKDHAVNDRSRVTELAVVLTPEGKLADVSVAKTSGSPDFDSSATDVVKAAPPFPVAPEETLSDDGKVHVLWKLARDDRRCSGLAVDVQRRPLEEAVPMLVAQGREALAIERLDAASDAERAAGMAGFARAWLDRAEDDKDLSLRIAVANASAGDSRGAERLRKALTAEGQTELAAQGLTWLKIGLCELLKDQLADPKTKASALATLSVAPDGDCLATVIALANDRHVAAPERIAAIQGLGTRDEPEARAALKGLLNDSTPAIRAAAILAEARPASGRGAMFRLTAILRDPSVEVRTAAAAALVRAAGEEAIPQLFLLFKEKAVRPYQAVANELGALSGEASAQLLARLLHKDDRRIQLAAARALARRHDPAAAKVLASLSATKDAELGFLAASASTDSVLRKTAASAGDGYGWTESCTAIAHGSGRLLAADWIIAQFPKLGPETRIDVMGTWLATNPASVK
jgi:TonB family protein